MIDTGRIYALIDPRDGRVRYVGKTVKTAQERLKDHLWSRKQCAKRPLYRWLNDLLASSLSPQIVVLEEVSFSDLERREQLATIDATETRWITHFREAAAPLLNLTTGGNGCHGRKMSDSHKAALSAKLTGRKSTPEQKENSRRGALRRDNSTRVRGQKHPCFGKPFTCANEEERVAKIKKALSTDEFRKSQGDRHRGEKNRQTSLTNDVVLAIYNESGRNIDIAKKFGVSYHACWFIRAGKSWTHVTGAKKEECVSSAG